MMRTASPKWCDPDGIDHVVKSLQSCRVRAVLSARHQLVTMRTSLYNQIRGLLKTFGVVLAPGKGTAVLAGCPTDPLVRAAMAALLAAWRVASARGRWSSSWSAWPEVAPRAGAW